MQAPDTNIIYVYISILLTLKTRIADTLLFI